MWLSAFENKSYIVALIMIKHVNLILCYPYFNSLNSFCFSAFQPHPNEVNTFPIYLWQEILVGGQFHKLQKF